MHRKANTWQRKYLCVISPFYWYLCWEDLHRQPLWRLQRGGHQWRLDVPGFLMGCHHWCKMNKNCEFTTLLMINRFLLFELRFKVIFFLSNYCARLKNNYWFRCYYGSQLCSWLFRKPEGKLWGFLWNDTTKQDKPLSKHCRGLHCLTTSMAQ